MKKIAVIISLVFVLISGSITAASAQTSAEELLQKYRDEAQLPESEIMFESESYITLDTEGKTIWRAPFAGIVEFKVPEEWINAEGGIRAIGGTESVENSGIVDLEVNYIVSEESTYHELTELIEGALNEENDDDWGDLYDEWGSMMTNLFTVYGISENRDEAGLREGLKKQYMGYGVDEETVNALLDQMVLTKAGSAEDFNFFFSQNKDEDKSALADADEVFVKEYEDFSSNISKYIPNFTFARPMGLTEFVDAGTGISFKTTDIEGNPIDTAELFGSRKVTMVNIWETSCGFCIGELPDLIKMNKDFQAKDAQIVGIVYDAMEDDLIEEARDIVNDLGVDYVTLLPTAEIRELFKVQSFPTTYFVNEKGEILGEPVLGAALDKFPEMVDRYLGR
jgi:thiol-disulfide isomerase/thioredoxin